MAKDTNVDAGFPSGRDGLLRIRDGMFLDANKHSVYRVRELNLEIITLSKKEAAIYKLLLTKSGTALPARTIKTEMENVGIYMAVVSARDYIRSVRLKLGDTNWNPIIGIVGKGFKANVDEQPKTININSTTYFDPQDGRVVRSGYSDVRLTRNLFTVFNALFGNPGCILSRDDLLNSIEDEGDINDRSMDSYIKRIRKLFKDDEWDPVINVYGCGYMANMDFPAPEPDERIDLVSGEKPAYFDKRNGMIIRRGYDPQFLAAYEKEIFQTMLESPNRIYSGREISDRCANHFNWSADAEQVDIRSDIKRIRGKLRALDLDEMKMIETVYGEGYVYRPQLTTKCGSAMTTSLLSPLARHTGSARLRIQGQVRAVR